MNCIRERRRQIHICILKERVWEIRQIGGRELGWGGGGRENSPA